MFIGAGIGLAQAWGGGLVASVDGMRFVVPVPSIYARPNPKYFGRRAGATWLNLLNDQAAGLGGKVVAGTPLDSLYVLYDRDGGRRPEMIVTDTASYSDIVFGLLTLAGYTYASQLADLPDAKMWRIDTTADYGPFEVAARGRIDLARIERHWEDILRIIGSIHTGAVRAYDVIRMLSRDGRPTPRYVPRASTCARRTSPGCHRSCAATSTCSAATPSPSPTCPKACALCVIRMLLVENEAVSALTVWLRD
ncbi:Tn3 family transposase [Streptosporangium sp. NBC_01495]|uniref:Tn3 family transposase n=1 Tax=Streptosporangium sp. NBC_01495 TaxID=2903899 RepID=UPI002E317586|nr:Tn3 family transposase [Streptosporangium sp. NBC_01495]